MMIFFFLGNFVFLFLSLVCLGNDGYKANARVFASVLLLSPIGAILGFIGGLHHLTGAIVGFIVSLGYIYLVFHGFVFALKARQGAAIALCVIFSLFAIGGLSMNIKGRSFMPGGFGRFASMASGTSNLGRSAYGSSSSRTRAANNLFSGARLGSVRFIKRALKAGADINGVDYAKSSALHYAVTKKRYKALKYLIKKGADIEAKDGKGNRALHLAVKKKHYKAVKYLLKKGATTSEENDDDKTPYQLTKKSKKYKKIRKILKKYKDQ